LSRMAGDFLSIPATSVPSERLFSDAGQLITNRRNCLHGDIIQACICLDSWWSTNMCKFRLRFRHINFDLILQVQVYTRFYGFVSIRAGFDFGFGLYFVWVRFHTG
jgi:hypothetical protein